MIRIDSKKLGWWTALAAACTALQCSSSSEGGRTGGDLRDPSLPQASRDADLTSPYAMKVVIVDGENQYLGLVGPVAPVAADASDPLPYLPSEFRAHSMTAPAQPSSAGAEPGGSFDSSKPVRLSAFALMYAAAAECGVGTGVEASPLLGSMTPEFPTWNRRADGTRAYSMFPRMPATCDEVIAYEDALVCTAGRLARVADAPATIEWSAVEKLPTINGLPPGKWELPPQGEDSRFIARDLARHLLASVAVVDMTVPSGAPEDGSFGTCAAAYSRAARSPAAGMAETNALFGASRGGLVAHFESDTQLDEASLAALVSTRLQANGRILATASRMLDQLQKDSVASDRAVTLNRIAHAGMDPQVGWGLVPSDAPRQNSFVHVAETWAGRLEIGAGTPLVGGLESNALSRALGDTLPAYAATGRPATTGAQAASDLFFGAGIVLPAAAIESSSDQLRDALVETLARQEAQRRKQDPSTVSAGSDLWKSFERATTQLSATELRYGAQAVSAAYQRDAGAIWTGVTNLRGVVANVVDYPAVAALGGGVVKGLGLGLDPKATRMFGVAGLRSLTAGEDTDPFGPRAFAATHASASELAHVLGRRQLSLAMEATGADDAAALSARQGAVAALADHPLSVRAHFDSLQSVTITLDGFADATTAAAYARVATVAADSVPALRCASGGACAASVRGWVSSPAAFSVTQSVSQPGKSSLALTFDLSGFAGEKRVFLANRGVSGVQGSTQAAISIPTSVPSLDEVGVASPVSDSVGGGEIIIVVGDGPPDDLPSYSSCDDYLDSYGTSGVVPPPPDGTTNTDVPASQTAWHYYIQAARTAAEKADTIAEEILGETLQGYERQDTAQDKLADLCGSYVSNTKVHVEDDGTVDSNDPTLSSCIDDDIDDVVFLSADPVLTQDACSGVATLQAELGCNYAGAPPSDLCDRLEACGGGDCSSCGVTHAGLKIAPYVGGPAIGSATCDNLNYFADNPSTAIHGILGSEQPHAPSATAEQPWLSAANVRGVLEATTLVELPDATWTLSLRERGVVMSSQGDSGVFPGCLRPDRSKDCDPRAVPYSAVFRPGSVRTSSSCNANEFQLGDKCVLQLGARFDDHDWSANDEARFVLWQVEGSLWSLAALVRYLPAGMLNVQVPVSNLNSFQSGPMLTVYASGMMSRGPDVGQGTASWFIDEQSEIVADTMPVALSMPHGAGYPTTVGKWWPASTQMTPNVHASFDACDIVAGATVPGREEDFTEGAMRDELTELDSQFNFLPPGGCGLFPFDATTPFPAQEWDGLLKAWGDQTAAASVEWPICNSSDISFPRLRGMSPDMRPPHLGIVLANGKIRDPESWDGDQVNMVEAEAGQISYALVYGNLTPGTWGPFHNPPAQDEVWSGMVYHDTTIGIPIGCSHAPSPHDAAEGWIEQACVAERPLNEGCYNTASNRYYEATQTNCSGVNSSGVVFDYVPGYQSGDMVSVTCINNAISDASNSCVTVYEPLHSILSPYSCSPDRRSPAFVNAYRPTDGCQAYSEMSGALAYACDAAGSAVGVDGSSTDPPTITSTKDIPKISAWISLEAIVLRKQLSKLYVTGVPHRVVEDFASGAVGTGSPQGVHGADILDIEVALQTIVRSWTQIATDLETMSTQVRLANAQIDLAKLDKATQLAQLEIQTIELQASLAHAVVSALVAAASTPTDPFGIPSYLAHAEGAGADLILTQQYNALIQAQLDTISSYAGDEEGDKVTEALAQLMQSTTQTLGDIQSAMTSLRSAVADALQASSAAKASSQEAIKQAAIVARGGAVDLGPTTQLLRVDDVLSREAQTNTDRYRTALSDARRLACYAKRSIEQNIGRKLEHVNEEYGPDDLATSNPSLWVNDLFLTDAGVTMSQYVVVDPGEFGTQFLEDRHANASAFVSDYVDRLETFANDYAVKHQTTTATDSLVFSLRHDILAPSETCASTASNDLLYAYNIGESGTVNPATGEAPGWSARPCADGACTSIGGGIAPPPGSAPISVPVADGVSQYVKLVTSAHAASSDPLAGFMQQAVTLDAEYPVGADEYYLSWWAASDVNGTARSYTVRVVDDGGALVSDETFTTGATRGDWGQRVDISFGISSPGVYRVGFRAGAADEGGSVLLTEPQLEAGKPSAYVYTKGSPTLYGERLCEASAADLRAAFSYECPGGTALPCDYKFVGVHPFQIPVPTTMVGAFFETQTVAVNLVGTGVHSCAGEGSNECYGSSFERYELKQDSSFAWGGSGGDVFNFHEGVLTGAPALAAERYLSFPLSSADVALIDQQGIERTDFFGRPLLGNYRLKIFDSPSLNWEALEDVQIIVQFTHRRGLTSE